MSLNEPLLSLQTKSCSGRELFINKLEFMETALRRDLVTGVLPHHALSWLSVSHPILAAVNTQKAL